MPDVSLPRVEDCPKYAVSGAVRIQFSGRLCQDAVKAVRGKHNLAYTTDRTAPRDRLFQLMGRIHAG